MNDLITDDFNVLQKDESGGTSQLVLSDGNLIEQTWVDLEPYLKEAKFYRDMESKFEPMKEGALGLKTFELPGVVLDWIVEKYDLAEDIETPQAKRTIFKAIEYDTMITPHGERDLPLKLLKHTNRKIA